MVKSASLLAAGLLASINLLNGPVEASKCHHAEAGVEYWGPVVGLYMNVESEDACCNWCEETATCTAYKLADTSCYLLSTVITTQAKTGVASARKA